MAHWSKSPEIRARRLAKWKAGRARAHAGEGFIYVAEMVGTDVVKIGFSLDPAKRMSSLGFFGKARLLAAVPGTWAQEKELHRTLCAARYGATPFNEFYVRRVLTHEAIPEGLRSAA